MVHQFEMWVRRNAAISGQHMARCNNPFFHIFVYYQSYMFLNIIRYFHLLFRVLQLYYILLQLYLFPEVKSVLYYKKMLQQLNSPSTCYGIEQGAQQPSTNTFTECTDSANGPTHSQTNS